MNNYKPIGVILADPHPLFRKGVGDFLKEQQEVSLKILYDCSSGADLLRYCQSGQGEIVVMDLNLKKVDGFSVLEAWSSRKLGQNILVLSSYNDPKLVQKALRLGASGYLLKSCKPQELLEAISHVIKGEQFLGPQIHPQVQGESARKSQGLNDGFARKYRLTKRETEILQLIAEALSNKEIANQLYISDQTVGVHRKNIMRKLGVNNIAELMRVAIYYKLDYH